MSDDLYRRLQQHLDRMPVGFPPTESGVELRLLRRLFTPERAALALELSAIPETVAVIHKRVKRSHSREALTSELDAMAADGLIEKMGRRTPKYCKSPLVVGIYERQLKRLTPELERDMLDYGREAFGEAFLATRTRQFRTVPVNVSIRPERNVAAYDDIREFVRATEGPFAVMTCICRHGKDLVGESCHQTTARENCLTFGAAAESTVRSGMSRSITRQDMLQLLDDADREGLVLQPQNTKEPLFVCCCCGCCCGVLTIAKRMPEPARYLTTNYVAVVDEARCEACGTCYARCQMDAISLDTGKAQVLTTHCIGCGLCLSTCQPGAMALAPTGKPQVPPNDTVALYMKLFQERFGAWGTAVAVAKSALGRKV
jgi:Pyruvate/2-oxoacid:ferredoxin oxidoreductase delta subunit